MIQKRKYVKHGYTKHELWGTYKKMLNRCDNPKSPDYKNYGGKGISVSLNWKGDIGFVTFLSDMGIRPLGFTLERKNNNQGYNKDNCIWASKKQQSQNRSTNVAVDFQGKKEFLYELEKQNQLPRYIIDSRRALGWTTDLIFTTPHKKFNKRCPEIVLYNNISYNFSDLIQQFSLDKERVLQRLNAGWTLEKAIDTPIKRRI